MFMSDLAGFTVCLAVVVAEELLLLLLVLPLVAEWLELVGNEVGLGGKMGTC